MTRSTSMMFVVSQLQEELTRLLHEAMALESSTPLEEAEPRVDILETDQALIVLAEVPGIDLDHLHLQVRERKLHLQADKSGAESWPKARFHCVECTRGGLTRQILLPPGFDSTRARAGLRDGLLRIEIPRLRPDESAARTIAIENLEESSES